MISNRLRLSDIEGLFLGKPIGGGIDRNVYALKETSAWGWRHKITQAPEVDDEECRHVIKVQKGHTGYFQNVAEWLLWETARATRLARWLAPCVAISPCGLYLIQRRVEPLRRRDLPKRMPTFLSDLKRENFGMLEGKVVCCDYGLGVDAGAIKTKLRKARWD